MTEYYLKQGTKVPIVFWFRGDAKKMIQKNYVLTKDRYFRHPTRRFRFSAKQDTFMVECGFNPESHYLFEESIMDDETFVVEHWVLAVNKLTVKKVYGS